MLLFMPSMNLKKHCGQKEIFPVASHLFPTRVVANFTQSLYFKKDVSSSCRTFSDETVVSDRHPVMDVTFYPFTIKENEMSGKDDEKRSGQGVIFVCIILHLCDCQFNYTCQRCLSVSALFSHRLLCHLSIVNSCLRYGYPCETVLVF